MDNDNTPTTSTTDPSLAKEMGKYFAINAAASVGAWGGLALVIVGIGAYMDRKAKKNAAVQTTPLKAV